MHARVSILLPTFNSAETVRETLESVKWADEILVVDSFSTDANLEICREFGARILQHEYLNSAKQKNWAVTQCKKRLGLQIDTDEQLEPVLVKRLSASLRLFLRRSRCFACPAKITSSGVGKVRRHLS
jgi:glycosyltransferase involved in cell wall biosynthesis